MAEIEARWPGFLDDWRSGSTVEIPGGEPWEEFVDRVVDGLEGLQAASQRTLVISHMGVQRAIEHCLGAPRSRYDNLDGLWVR